MGEVVEGIWTVGEMRQCKIGGDGDGVDVISS
jgi:hypothetical protein